MIFLPRKTNSQKTSKHIRPKRTGRAVPEFFDYNCVPNFCCFQIGRDNISGKNLVNCLHLRTNPNIFPKYENNFYPIVKK